MIVRIAKVLLVTLIGLFSLLVGVDNIVDYGTNYAFVQHVMSMDTVFPNSTLTWRAITSPALHHAAYAGIIAAELLTGVLCLFGALKLWNARSYFAPEFNAAKDVAIAGLVLRLRAVVLRLHGRRRRMVPDVAVANLERPGGRLPLHRLHRLRAHLPRAEGRRACLSAITHRNAARR